MVITAKKLMMAKTGKLAMINKVLRNRFIFLSLPKVLLLTVQVHMRFCIVVFLFQGLIGWLIGLDVVYL